MSLSTFRVWAFFFLLLVFLSNVCTTRAFSVVQPTTTTVSRRSSCSTTRLFANSASDEDLDDDEDEDEDDFIDTDSLGDWRSFRRSLTTSSLDNDNKRLSTTASSISSKTTTATTSSSSTTTAMMRTSQENQELLKTQNSQLANEYAQDAWAHETYTPEVGGLVVRLPLEVEIFRNYKHSIIGKRFRERLQQRRERHFTFNTDSEQEDPLDLGIWYAQAQQFIHEEMQKVSKSSNEQGQIDSDALPYDSREMLALYLDCQDTWQEVCLVLDDTERSVVLNRPMAKSFTEGLAQLVLFGHRVTSLKMKESSFQILMKFLVAFGTTKSAVYFGGPDRQEEPALIVHGYKDIPGATEIGKGNNVYRGGDITHIINGVLDGTYKPLDFKFFVGCHDYTIEEEEEEKSIDAMDFRDVRGSLEVLIQLGKYQPVASARSISLKQCLGLPKPLWHEVLDLCGGDMADISSLEMLKRDDMTFEVEREDDDDDDDDDDDYVDYGFYEDDDDEEDEDDDDDEILDKYDEDDDDSYYRRA